MFLLINNFGNCVDIFRPNLNNFKIKIIKIWVYEIEVQGLTFMRGGFELI